MSKTTDQAIEAKNAQKEQLKEVKLNRFQVFKNDVLELHSRQINQANTMVEQLKAQNVAKVTFKDTKDGETVTHTKDRYSKNYRVRRSSK